jgi:outer membrane protein TolC
MLDCKQVLARIHSWDGVALCLAILLLTPPRPARAQTATGGRAGTLASQLPLSGRPNAAGSVAAAQSPAPAGSTVNTLNTSVQVQGAFQGSVLAGPVSPTPLTLTLEEAVKRGLRYNLGAVAFAQAVRQARGERYAALSRLLPNLAGNLSETTEQLNLATFGLRSFPGGVPFPAIAGPFNFFDLRASLSQNVFDLTALRNYRAAREMERATQLSARDARDLVVLAVSGGYLQVIAAAAQVEAARAQVAVAQALYQQAVDRHAAGMSARIDVTRSQVELQTEQNRLTSQLNDLAKQKINLARSIGLPVGQEYVLGDTLAYIPLEVPALDQAISQAVRNRADLRAAESQVRAAEEARRSARAEYLPSLFLDADYGASGPVPSNSHGVFAVAGGLRFPIWEGGRVRGDIEQAEAALAQRRAEYEDLRQRVEADVRTAFLDISAAAEQVRVAQSNRDLAQQTLAQARDRFAAGVANTIEVVQAQEAVAAADQDYIASLFAHNLAKVALARAMGEADQNIPKFLKGR